MSTETERLQTAQWVLERNLAWIAAADVKVGVIMAIDTGMLGGLGAAFSASNVKMQTCWAVLFTVTATILLGLGLITAARATFPLIQGPAKSLVFFGRIRHLAEPDYINEFKTATVQQLLDDWSAQIHCNAQIADKKFTLVRQAMLFSFLAIIPWFAGVFILMHK